MKLRYYQEAAVDATFAALKEVRSVLIQSATGTGKTPVLCEIARRFASRQCRVLILAHREELIQQIAEKLSLVAGITAAIEKAEKAEAHEIVASLLEQDALGVGPDGKPLVVVGSVQSMARRLDRFKPDHFDLVLIDEAHHGVARTYRAIIDHFAEAKVVGCTATADRGDRVALGEVFDRVAFEFEIADAIQQGWLVPIEQQTVATEHLDLSKVRTTAGDLNLGDLEQAMTQTDLLHEIAGPTVEIAGDRQGIIFAVTVEHAYLLAEAVREQIIDRWLALGRGKPPDNIVVALDGTSSAEERAEAIAAYRRGEVQWLSNAALFTEGTDLPSTEVVVMAAPTKSRLRFAQMVGRGSRPLPGVVDAYPGRDQADARRSAIASSPKPSMLVVDFAGNAGKHTLVSPADLLAGDFTEPELALAKGMLRRQEVKDILEALRLARAKIKEMAELRAQARRGYQTAEIDPFDASAVAGQTEGRRFHRQLSGPAPPPSVITAKQRKVLEMYGVENVDSLRDDEALRLLEVIDERNAAGLASFKQVRVLMRRGHVAPDRAVDLSHEAAARAIAELARNRWRRPRSWMIKFGPPMDAIR